MTAKQTATLRIVASQNEIDCDIDFYVGDEEVEIFDILLEGNSIMHPMLLMSEDELEAVAQELYDTYGD